MIFPGLFIWLWGFFDLGMGLDRYRLGEDSIDVLNGGLKGPMNLDFFGLPFISF